MKHVAKGESPESFERWKANANANWQPSYGDLQNPEKRDLHDALLKEQGWVCCYCGRRFTREDQGVPGDGLVIERTGSHIEHFRPQESYPEQALCYENLFVSCIRAVNPGTPLHCGHAKGNAFDEAWVISPTDPLCEQHFGYALDGQIIPKGKKAEYMCGLLRLNVAFLMNRRAAVLEGVFDANFLAMATEDELDQLRKGFAARNVEGQFPDFGHVLERFLTDLMGGTDRCP